MGRCNIIHVFFLGFVAVLNTEAAISPLDETYTASVGTDLTIPWSFDNEADMSTVIWSHKTTATTTTVMSKTGTNVAVVFNNFNMEHVSNGEVKLKSFTMENAGIYYCEVSYSLVSLLPTVTGTATISIIAQTTTVSVTVFESDDVTLACTLTGSFTLPEWRGPPQLMKYTNKDDTSETISHQAPAAGRLQYASNKKDLVLYHAERNDSGDYSCSYKALGVHTVILTVTDTTTPAKTISTWDHGPFTTHFPGTLQQIHIKDNKVPVKGGEVQIVCDIVHFSDADTVRVYKTDSILTSDITTAQSLASCNPTMCFGTEPRHTFSSSYSGVIITITNLHSSDDQKYWTCVMNNQQISMQLTVYYSRSDIYTSTTETSYTMSIVLGAVCFVGLIYAIGLTILYKRKTKKEGSASNSENGTYANKNLGNISDATVAQHYENEATVLPSPQYTELAHYTNERTTYERLQN